MGVATLSAWLLSVMMATVPPGGSRQPKEARETAAQGKARYQAIAKAVAEAALDPKETPLFAGDRGRTKTALLLLTISLHESHWRRHIDLGLGPIALRGRGRYHCMMQIAVPKKRTPEGWTAADLVKRRDKCFRRALHILQGGKRYCTQEGFAPRAFLNQYASGHCDRGRKPVAIRWRTFDRLRREHALAKQPPDKDPPAKRKPGPKPPPRKPPQKPQPRKPAPRKPAHRGKA